VTCQWLTGSCQWLTGDCQWLAGMLRVSGCYSCLSVCLWQVSETIDF